MMNAETMAESVKIQSSEESESCDSRLAEGEDLEEQINECIALQSIYENEDFEICSHDNVRKGDLPGGIFNIPIFPNQPFEVKMTKDLRRLFRLGHGSVRGRGRKRNHKQDSNVKKCSDEKEKLYPIKRLPPLTLTFAYPHDYPSENPPKFTLLCSWLEKRHLSQLCRKLDEIWEAWKGTPIIMNWVSFLQEDTIHFLNLTSPYELGCVLVNKIMYPPTDKNNLKAFPSYRSLPFDSRGIQAFGSLDELMTKVLDFNLVSCEVCFEEKAGEHFLRLVNCSEHLLCKDCMRGWFEERIGEGAINDLRCPGYKCDKAVLPTEVKSVVDPDLYQRYEKLLLKTAFDVMTDVINCPRPFCQFPVVLEENLGLCQKCQHAFCGRCQNTYHGHTPCKLKSDMYSKLCTEYETCTPERRKEIELHYGKATIKRALEEVKSNRWLEKNSKQCPCCSTFIQKNDGCNKMTCTNCRTYFCWLCHAELSRSDPYNHYQHPTSPCSNRLFEGMDLPDVEDDVIDYLEAQGLLLGSDDDEDDDDDDDIEFLVEAL